MITLTVNGKPRDLEGPQNLVDYLEALGITQRAIAIAYNGDIIRKNELQQVTLEDGDKLEIVRAVGGG
ncbi:MAG TPA: thiamine biosynthesis protein ThiS [Dehalococcoidia bacterium]|nr:thiamine biosynthesis protein ThiS [Dehalococcoidia bacterium]